MSRTSTIKFFIHTPYLIAVFTATLNLLPGFLFAITQANAGRDTTICQSSYTLNANTPGSGETGTWTFSSPSLSISNVNAPNAVISNFSDGSVYKLIWTLDDGSGTTSSDTVYITYQSSTQSFAGNDQCLTIPSGNNFISTTLSGNSTQSWEQVSWSVISSPTVTQDSIISPNTASTSVMGISSGIHIFVYTISNTASGCFSSDTLKISAVSQAISSSDTCLFIPVSQVNTSLVISGVMPASSETSVWKDETPSSSAILTSPNASSTSVTNLTRGVYDFYYILNQNGCQDSSLTRISVTTRSVAGSDTCILQGASLQLHADSIASFESGKWTAFKPLSFSNITNYNTTVSGFPADTASIIWSVTDSSGICSSSSSLVVTSITIPNAGADICEAVTGNNQTLSLSGNTPASTETAFWYSINGDSLVTYSNPATLTLAPGVYQYTWNIRNAVSGCQKKDTVNVTLVEKSLAGNNQCLPGITSTALNANTPGITGETGQWTSFSGLSFSFSNPKASLSGLPDGVHKLKWTLDLQGCRDSSYVSISVISLPEAGLSQCITATGSNASAILNGSTVNTPAETGLWSISPSSPSPAVVFTPKDSSNSTVTNLQIGNNKLYWTIKDTSGTCSASDSLGITVLSPANAGADQCHSVISGNTISISLSGSNLNTSYEKAYWTSKEGISITNPNQANATVTLGAGIFTFYYTIANLKDSCQNSDSVLVKVITRSMAGNNQCISSSSPVINLSADTAHTSIGETGTWVSYSGLTFNLSDPNAVINNPPVGVHKLMWKLSNQGCSDSSFVLVSVISQPSAGPSQCVVATGSSTNAILSATALAPNETGLWTISGSSPSPSVVFTPADSNISQLSNLEPGVNKFFWAIKDTASSTICSSDDSTLITVVSLATAGNNQCLKVPSGGTVTASLNGSAFVASREKVYWTSADGISITNASQQNASVTLGAGVFKFYYTIENLITGCKNTDSVLVKVITQSIAGTNQCISSDTPVIQLNADAPNTTAGETGTWTSYSGLSFSFSNPTAQINNPPFGIHKLKWTLTNQGCSDFSFVTISVLSKPSAGSSQCIPSATTSTQVMLSGSTISPGEQGDWSIIPAQSGYSVSFSPVDSNISTANNVPVGLNKFVWTLKDTATGGTCNASDTIPVTIVSKAIAGPDQCLSVASGNTDSITLTGSSFNSFQEKVIWSSNQGITITNSNMQTASANVGAGVYTFYYRIENILTGCQSMDSVVIKAVTQSKAGNNQCVTGSPAIVGLAANAANSAVGETGIWTSQTGLSFNFSDSNAVINNVPGGVHVLQWTLENQGCKDSSQVIISVVTQPVAGPLTCIPSTGSYTQATLHANPINSVFENGTWSLIPNPTSPNAQFNPVDSNVTVVSNIQVGSNSFVWTITDTLSSPICRVTDTAFVVIVTAPDAGPTQCLIAPTGMSKTSYLTGNSGDINREKGFWTSKQGLTIPNYDKNNTSIALFPGIYTFYWNIQNIRTGCIKTDSVIVKVVSQAVAGNPLCISGIDSTISLSADSLKSTVGETGVWSEVNGGSLVFSNKTSPQSQISNLTPGVHLLSWQVNNQGCSSSDTVAISIISKPNAGTDQCLTYSGDPNTTSTVLIPDTLNPSSEKGTWTITPSSSSAGTVVFETPYIDTVHVYGLKTGINYMVWTIRDTANGKCFASDTVKVSVLTNPNAGNDQCLTIPYGAAPISVTLSGNNMATGETGTWSSTSGVKISNASGSKAYTNLTQGKYDFLWSISNNQSPGCSFSDKVTVRVITKANAGTPQCLGSDLVNTFLDANPIATSAGETGTWTNITNPATVKVVSINDPKSQVTNLQIGVHTLKWEVSNGTCSDQSTVTLSVITKPNAGPNQCLISQGASTITSLAANTASTFEISSWVPSDNALQNTIISNPSSPVSNISIERNGSYVLYWTIQDSAKICKFEDSVTISVLTNPKVSGNICQVIPQDSNSTSIVLNALNAVNTSTETGIWTDPAGITILNPQNSKTTAPFVPRGKIQFKWTLTSKGDSSCIRADSLIARVISKSVAGANQCHTTSASPWVSNAILNAIPAISSAGETGYWTSSGIQNWDSTNAKSKLLNLSLGIHTFKWIIKNETCMDSSTVNISVQTQANAGTNDSTCQTNFVLNGNTPVSSTEYAFWKKINTTAQFSDSLTPSTSVSGLQPSENIFVWTIANTLCSNSDTVIIDDDQPTQVKISTANNQHTCFTANIFTGNDPKMEISTSKSLWEVISQPAGNTVQIADSSSDSTLIKNMKVPGTYTVKYSIFNSTCDTISDTISMIRDQTIPGNFAYASLGGVDTVTQACVTDTLTLTAKAAPSDGTGVWYVVSGYGTFQNPNTNITQVYNLAADDNDFYWKISRGDCYTIKTVSIKGFDVPSPAVVYTADQTLCAQDTVLLKAEPPVTGTGIWIQTQGSGILNTINGSTTLVTQLGAGKNVFKWSVSNGACTPNEDSVVIYRYEQETPAQLSQNPLFICGNFCTLEAKPVSIGTGTWSIFKGSADIAAPNSYNSEVTNLNYGSNILVWKVVNGTCSSTDTLTINASKAPDTAHAGPDIFICNKDSVTLSAQTPSIGTGTWLSSGFLNIKNIHSPNTLIYNIPKDTSVMLWEVKESFCVSRDTLLIVRSISPDVPNAGNDQNIYSSSTYLSANKINNGMSFWTVVGNNSVVISNVSDPTTMVSSLTEGLTQFVWNSQNGTCPILSDTVNITVHQFDIPNAFSPNGDQKNNEFVIKGLEAFGPADFTVFDRWGEIVFHSKDYQSNWDGKNLKGQELVDDTYYYVLKVKDNNVYQGFIVLKR